MAERQQQHTVLSLEGFMHTQHAYRVVIQVKGTGGSHV